MVLTVRKVHLEVAAFSAETALKAQTLGASRIELNARGSYDEGGLTPALEELKKLRAHPRKLTIPVHVMIRPRGPPGGGKPDFIYSAKELAEMIISICKFKSSGLMSAADGDRFVFGAIQEFDNIDPQMDGVRRTEVDETICKALVETAKPFGSVFHRAFDPIAATPYAVRQAEKLIDLGFQCLLTAGDRVGGCLYQDNTDKIDNICRRVGEKLQIIAGGGVRKGGLKKAAEQLAVYEENALWFHTASIQYGPKGEATEELDTTELIAMLNILGRLQRINSFPERGSGLYGELGFSARLVLFEDYLAVVPVSEQEQSLVPRSPSVSLCSSMGRDIPLQHLGRHGRRA
ncbi:copper homeostasis protein cutC [Purpureocillium lilacinum]|uniref:Copper homeostasis protein cutC homolog n=1 Tax=Purpureocillium lilacinum TaxID=33203 RepID=A0A179H5F5_PURLI|nr:copper homeostasis protein cutC [Purpureocillium lilacinum]OAQ85416.1 copper homeostasis protein cutC [Purpureocillium lilacinum]